MAKRYMDSPVGMLCLTEQDGALTMIEFLYPSEEKLVSDKSELLNAACRQLGEYFAGDREVFTLPLNPAGTAFQKDVWKAIREIPYAQTRSYRDVALLTGHEKAFRAVGLACGKNPIPIIIPCHRVVGADGRMTGYGGGIRRKEILLDIEKRGRDCNCF